MKPISEAADMHADFAGDESTSVMGVDLLSSLTERSRRIDVSPVSVPEPEISIAVEEPEPVTTMRPAAPPLPPPPAPAQPLPQLLIVDGEYPLLDGEESTTMMEQPEPTTVAVRSHIDKPLPSSGAPAGTGMCDTATSGSGAAGTAMDGIARAAPARDAPVSAASRAGNGDGPRSGASSRRRLPTIERARGRRARRSRHDSGARASPAPGCVGDFVVRPSRGERCRGAMGRADTGQSDDGQRPRVNRCALAEERE